MHSGFLRVLAVFIWSLSLLTWSQRAGAQDPHGNGGDFSTNTHPTEIQKVPTGVILIKGAWASASDSVTPLPEGGTIANKVYTSQYFGLSYPLPEDWFQKHQGPPPSETGRYVLAQIRPADTFKGPTRGNILITAQDMFFTQVPAANALQLVNYTKNHLQSDYKVEIKPTETKVAGQSFTFFAYWSPVAELHWYVLATQIRCHTVEMVFSSQDTKLLEGLLAGLNKMRLPAEAGPTAGTGGGDAPVCVKDYANTENVIERVDPQFTDHRFNAVPVRIIIDKAGKVKHVHFISAFPDQAQAISEALKKWRFKPFIRNGERAEVETGIMFGRASHPVMPSSGNSAIE